MYEIEWKINTQSFSLINFRSINILFWVSYDFYLYFKNKTLYVPKT